MTYSTGVAERDSMLMRAIQTAKACGDPLTVEALSSGHLPHDFDVDQDEIDGMVSNLPPPPTPKARGPLVITTLPDGRKLPPPDLSPETLEKIEPPRAVEAAQPHEDTAEATPGPNLPSGSYDISGEPAEVVPKIREAEARRALDVANARLTAARDNMAVAKGILKERRTDLASAITQWQMLAESATEGISKEQREQRELRRHLEAQNAERAERVKRRNNNAAAYVVKRMAYGPQRGAYSEAARNRAGGFNHDPRRGAVQKLPSDQ